ncbi:DUF4034 domain-containing protein [Silvimonas iriomotensis]|uniref:DUF4034 domain-containing protein n=1 Tax=Silvimonas iriomotensis TaxID=449662 RepID=A0ABQ2PBE4_9NEIS|nr:DUF4034 domain-containing protein [Silvimonas iriomotensis]GGP22698.1 hypothetical protein GCM10010970_26980 [Silvimonas iriomotensis]
MLSAFFRFNYAVLGLFILLSTSTACAITASAAPSGKYSSLLSLVQKHKFAELDKQLNQLQTAYEAGKIGDVDLAEAFYTVSGTQSIPDAFYDEWVIRYPGSYAARVVRGEHFKRQGLLARGAKSARATPKESMDKMQAYFDQAVPDFQASLQMAHKPVISYLDLLDLSSRVATSEENRALFDEGLKAAPDSFVLRRKYMRVLETRWGGSLDDMTRFLGECKGTGLTPSQMNILQAMVYQESGWLAVQGKQPQAALPLLSKAADLFAGQERLLEPGAAAEVLGQIAYINLQDKRNEEALLWFNRAIGQIGDCFYCSYLYANRGLIHERLQQFDEALLDYMTAADLGNTYALNRLGHIYTYGEHVPQDKAKGTDYYSRAVAIEMASAPAKAQPPGKQ